MARYEVVAEGDADVDVRGEVKHLGDQVELSEEDAAELVAAGSLKLVGDQGAGASGEVAADATASGDQAGQ